MPSRVCDAAPDAPEPRRQPCRLLPWANRGCPRPRVWNSPSLAHVESSNDTYHRGPLDHQEKPCSNGSPTEPAASLCLRKKKRACSTTTTSELSTFCSVSSTRARVLLPRLLSPWVSHSMRSASRSKRSSARVSSPRPGTSRSRPGPKRCWSFRCARACSWGTTTSAPSTSCSVSSVRARESPRRCWLSWVLT